MSETWLSGSIENRYSLPGFRAFYCSRDLGTGGGSALYIANNFSSIQLKNPTFTRAEVVCVQIKLRNASFVVCQIYRSPSTDRCLFNSELEQCLIWLSKMNKTTLITGDFNFDLFSIDSSPTIQTFFNTLLSHGFFPTISRTTRSSHPSYILLDTIFCNDLSRMMCSGVIVTRFHFLNQFPKVKTTRFIAKKHLYNLQQYICQIHPSSHIEKWPTPSRTVSPVSGINLFGTKSGAAGVAEAGQQHP